MRIANEENEGKNVKAVTFKLHEPLHNLDGAKQDSLVSIGFIKTFAGAAHCETPEPVR